jgi:hypothetical protein
MWLRYAPGMSETFDASRARLKGPDYFPRFTVPDVGTPLGDAGLPDDSELIIIERGGVRRAFLPRELAHPHVAQGRLAGEPYLVSF